MIRALCLSAVSLSACSFGVRAVRDDYDPAVHGEPVCDQEAGGRQVIDTLLTIGALVGTAIALTKTLNDDISKPVGIAITSTSIAVAGVTIAGVSVARKRTARCQRAVRLYYERLEKLGPARAPPE